MENNTTPAKHALSYGITFGVILVLEFMLMYTLNIDPNDNAWAGVVMNLLNYLVLPFALIYTAATKFKKEINEGFLSLSQSLKIGISITVLAALIYGVFYIIFDLIFPEFKEELFEKIQEVTAKTKSFDDSRAVKDVDEIRKNFHEPIRCRAFYDCYVCGYRFDSLIDCWRYS